MIPLSVAFISSPGAPHSHRYPDTQIPSAITFITKPCQLHLLAPQELLARYPRYRRYPDTANTPLPQIPRYRRYPATEDTPLPHIPRYRRYPAIEDIENDKMDRECKNGKRMTKWTENEEMDREEGNGKRMRKWKEDEEMSRE